MHRLVAIAPLPPVPRHDLLTYRIPEPLRERVRPGVRVRVPLGRQTRTGVVAAFADTLPPGELRSIVDVLDADPFLPADLLELCRWTARYYLASLAEVIATIVPASVPRPSEERALRLARRLSAEEETALARRAPARARAYHVLAAAPDTQLTSPAARAAGIGAAALRALVAAGLAEPIVRARATAAAPEDAPRPTLTPAQRTAADAIAQAVAGGGHASFLLHGITGSGKTEVFLAAAGAADRALAARGGRGRPPRPHRRSEGPAPGLRGAPPRARGEPRRRRADARLLEPPRLRGLPAVRRLRRRPRLPAVQRDPRLAPRGRGARLPPLPPHASATRRLPGVRRARSRGVRGGDGADRGRAARLLPAGGRRPARPRRRAAPRRAAPHPARLARGNHRHPGRHADGEQGARRAGRDPGRRAARRSVAQRARLPRRRAHLPAPRAGGGPRRPRRHPGARGGADLPPRAPERGGRRAPRLRRLHGARARPPPHARLPALRAPRQPAARRPGRRRGRARRARAGRAHAPPCARA